MKNRVCKFAQKDGEEVMEGRLKLPRIEGRNSFLPLSMLDFSKLRSKR